MSVDVGVTVASPPSGSVPGSLFGLDAEETAVLREAFAELATPLGVDADHILNGLGRGEPLARLLNLPSQVVELLYSRAHMFFTAGRFDRSETLFRALCALDSGVADYWVGYGVCLRRRGCVAEAELAFATAAALRPEWAVPHFHAAQIALGEAQWRRAADHLAAFAECAGPATPASMRQEADRQRRALASRDGKART